MEKMKMNFKTFIKAIQKEAIRFSTELHHLQLQENVHYRAIPMLFSNNFSIRGSFIFYTQNGMSVMCYGNQSKKKKHHLKPSCAGTLKVNEHDINAIQKAIDQTKQKIQQLQELIYYQETDQKYLPINAFLEEGNKNGIDQGYQLMQWSSSTTFDYFISSYSLFSSIGTIYIRCADGIISLPIIKDEVDKGDEQFNLSKQSKLYKRTNLHLLHEEITYAIKEYKKNIKWLEKIHQTIRLKLLLTN